jgi:hypothetical protein
LFDFKGSFDLFCKPVAVAASQLGIGGFKEKE